jgi:hypothetical protein
MADHGPFRRTLETAGLQGKKTGLRDSCPLGPGWTRLPTRVVGLRRYHTGVF